MQILSTLITSGNIFGDFQEGSRMFKQVEEGSIIKGAIGFQRVLTGSRRFKKTQE